jgi:regulatory protein YycH of two-component signal transduction system YycFG
MPLYFTPDDQSLAVKLHVDASTQRENDNLQVAKKKGRPQIDVNKRISAMKRKVNALTQKVIRLQKKERIQNLLEILQRENKLQNSQLNSMDECLSELVKNGIINRNQTNKFYSITE